MSDAIHTRSDAAELPAFSAAAWVAEALRLGFAPVAVIGDDRTSVYIGNPVDPTGDDVPLWRSIRTPDPTECAQRWADVRAELMNLGRCWDVAAGCLA